VITSLCLAAALLVQGAGVTVSGRVMADEATLSRVVRVAIAPSAGGEARTTLVDSDGSFDFSSVAPGSYMARAYASTSVSPPMAVSVSAKDVANVTLQLPPPKSVHGRIVVQGNLPATVAPPRLAFALAPLPGIPGSGSTVAANPQPDGTFTITLPVGERPISIVPGGIPPGYKTASFIYGATDLLKNPIKVASGDNVELRVALDARAVMPVKVSGRVTDLLTTAGVRVVLTHQIFGSVEASVQSDGSFVFPKVLPGNYVARLSLSGLSASRQVTVADRDMTDVVITYPRQFVVASHIIVEGSANATPELVLEARNVKGTARPSTALSVNNLAMFTLKDGEYNVSLQGVPAGFQLRSITYGTTDLQKTPLKIDGPVTWEIIVRLIPAPR
jgi:hypothetical protein